MDVKIKLDMFEGPLDLLLHLIDRSEVDVCDIPIARITDQYMEILSASQELELDIASEFLVMAATLLAIKSRMLLPRAEPVDLSDMMETEDGLDPREELVQRLLEYKKYKRLSDALREREAERSQVYTRMPMDLTPYTPEENPLQGLTPDDLLQVFSEAMSRPRNEEPPPMTNLSRDEVSVSDRMEEIAETLWRSDGKMRFSELLVWERVTKDRVVTTFLALLELMKTKRVYILQRELFQDIEIVAVKPNGGEPTGTTAVEVHH
ncbi:segregation and condensation protein A [Desmospora profundinema]|uniref:Segregation and condensation protein A n=1 Tax=Desmospora profundinema TaxID=1571184 RepID=A0ABU1IIF7_9BACL|nr:segregation/condensation protein A [Desmospora profundinema]MDR6224555.1 segregation and condensation protein A [Desmospora profundinema]